MRTLRARLTLGFLAVILIGMGVIAPLAWLAVERLYLNTQSASLLAQAEMVAAALKGQNLAGANPIPYSQAANTLPGIHTRVIDAQGGVVIEIPAGVRLVGTGELALPSLAQGEGGWVTPAGLAARPEIAQALAGQATTAVRTLDSQGGKRVLYAAAPVLSTDGRVSQIVYLAMPLPDSGWTGLPPAARWQFAAVILGAVLLASTVGLFFASRLSKPLDGLVTAAQAISAGDLNQSVPVDGEISEISALGRAFNQMAASLRQADQAKTAFVSDVSHELRTPLTVIKGTIETLQDGALDDRAARDAFLASMYRETERLVRLVNDLLVLTRADAGALNLQIHPVDLEALARARCSHFSTVAGARQVCLSVAAQPGSPLLCAQADPDRITQVLDNLLDNAIRYSPAGGEISVLLRRESNWIACEVRDSGPGIPARHLPLVFERFYRADPARDRARGGSGLGLAIVRSLVEAQGGEVSVQSVEGQGAVFTFWLPLAA
ncbi:MAG TPA: ATP-binding protein [Anaerolineaceae bacterium]|nr:ATP-binding protein [Anaerolineaceae bacterium]